MFNRNLQLGSNNDLSLDVDFLLLNILKNQDSLSQERVFWLVN